MITVYSLHFFFPHALLNLMVWHIGSPSPFMGIWVWPCWKWHRNGWEEALFLCLTLSRAVKKQPWCGIFICEVHMSAAATGKVQWERRAMRTRRLLCNADKLADRSSLSQKKRKPLLPRRARWNWSWSCQPRMTLNETDLSVYKA